jgi:hypothetical protein
MATTFLTLANNVIAIQEAYKPNVRMLLMKLSVGLIKKNLTGLLITLQKHKL